MEQCFFSQKRKKIIPILSWIIISWWLMCNRWLLFRLCETIKCCGCVPLVPTNEHLPFLLSSKPITWPAFYCLWCQFPLTVLEFNQFYFTKIVVNWSSKNQKKLKLSFEAILSIFFLKNFKCGLLIISELYLYLVISSLVALGIVVVSNLKLCWIHVFRIQSSDILRRTQTFEKLETLFWCH